MKLVYAIVQHDDAMDLMDKLTTKGFGVTKIASTGGFLRSGNTTLMIGVEKEKVDEVIDVIKEQCTTRDEIITTTSPMMSATDSFITYPVEVQVGGATIFVVDVDKFMKI